MAIKVNPAKAKFVVDLLASNGNRFTPDELVAAAGNERRARSALSHARMSGVTLEAIRDAGRAVTAYVFNGGSLPSIAATPKASKGSAKAKVAAAPKPVKTKSTKAKSEKSVRAINAAHTAKVIKSDADVAAIKEANLATMRAVSAKQSKAKAKSRLTEEQQSIRDEFYAEEAELARIEERAALRNNAPAFLFKESYSE